MARTTPPKKKTSTKPATPPASGNGNVARADAERPPARPDAVLQRRGVERVRAILDTAERILAEQGYEAATLKAIGDRAGIPTASVYHYFADRYQVDAELMRRHIQGMEQDIAAELADESRPNSLRDAVNAVMDPTIAYFRAHPSSVELWFSGRNDLIVEIAQAFDEATATLLWRRSLERGLLRKNTPLMIIQLAFAAGNSLFDVAFRLQPGGDDAVLAEARNLLTAYLETHAPPTPSRRRRS